VSYKLNTITERDDRMADDGRWNEGAHGIYFWRTWYDPSDYGDNWSYIDPRTCCIVNYAPEGEGNMPRVNPQHVAGPFPNVEAAKAAFLIIYGTNTHE